MKVYVNDEPRETAAETLGDLLGETEGLPEYYSAAVNGDFVEKSRYAALKLKAGDRVAVFAFAAGG